MITRRLIRPLRASTASSWICPSCTQPSRTIQPNLLLRRTFAVTPRRHVSIPDIAYGSSFAEHGVPGLLSPQGFALAWTQYQAMMIRKVNELTAGEAIENARMKDLVLQFARDPMNASLFNHASMAWNNYFFFSTLAPVPVELAKAARLQDSLTAAFGSIDSLRTTMLNTADAMFGPGFVWLVWARSVDPAAQRGLGQRAGSWKILTTYLAGTPLPEAGYRQQGLDMNTNNEGSFANYLGAQPVNTVGAFGAYSETGRQQAKLPPGGTTTIPVLCINTWEHVWIYDYGLGGKRQFLSDWWDIIDWAAVEQYMPTDSKGFTRHFQA